VEEIVRAVVTDAFTLGGSVTEECREGSNGGDGGNLRTRQHLQTRRWTQRVTETDSTLPY
jgi:hypothetical protein